MAGCAPRGPAVVAPVADPEGAADELEQETRLDEAIRIEFQWRLNEDRQRHRGIGLARIEPPYRARLDLWTDDLETVTTAVLIDGELRLPPGSRDDILPPIDLMWGVLGVFRPHDVLQLGADRLEGDAMRLRYTYEGRDDSELRYEVAEGLVRSVELLEDGHVVQRVQVETGEGDRYPVEATYRNLTAFRELTIQRDSLRRETTFDPSIWDPAQ